MQQRECENEGESGDGREALPCLVYLLTRGPILPGGQSYRPMYTAGGM